MSNLARVNSLPPLDVLQRYSLPEACLYLRISRAKLYLKIKNGELPIIKDGGRHEPRVLLAHIYPIERRAEERRERLFDDVKEYYPIRRVRIALLDDNNTQEENDEQVGHTTV